LTSERTAWQFARALVLAGLWLVVSAAHAVDAAHFKAGPFYVVPTFAGEFRYIDNLLRSEHSSIDTWSTVLKPRVQTWLQDGFNTYSLSYELVDYTYSDSGDDDATDHKLDLDIHHELNERHTLNLVARYYQLHEERGVGLTEGDTAIEVDAPVEFDFTRVGGEYTLGNQRSSGLLKLEALFDSHDYQNFNEITDFYNRDTSRLRGTFFYQTGTRSRALAEVLRIETDYKEDYLNNDLELASPDSTEYVALVGMAWAATAKTSGEIKVGGYQRDHKESYSDDKDGFHWEVNLLWNPRTYSSLELGTRRLSRETYGEGDYIDSARYETNWNHIWSHRVTSQVSFQYDNDAYIGSPREDKRYKGGASVDYSLRRWVDLNAGYRYEKRSSSEDNLSYDRNVFFFGFRMSL